MKVINLKTIIITITIIIIIELRNCVKVLRMVQLMKVVAPGKRNGRSKQMNKHGSI